MKKWLGLGIALGVFAAFAGACSSSSPPPPFPDVASFCQAKAKEECQVAPTCAIDPGTCQVAREKACNDAATAATASGARVYTQDNAQACIDKVHAAYGSPVVKLADLQGDGSIEDVCERVFVGNADKNKPCTTNYDCASGRVCAPVQPGVAQTVCADKTPANVGDFCANPGTECATGSYCATSMAGAAQCTARGAVGAACTATSPCLESLRCFMGTCVDRAKPGEACNSNNDCPDVDPYCDPYAGNICAIGLSFATGAPDCKVFQVSMTPGDAGTTSDAQTPPSDASMLDTAPALDGASNARRGLRRLSFGPCEIRSALRARRA
jgi:hypothetical protein